MNDEVVKQDGAKKRIPRRAGASRPGPRGRCGAGAAAPLLQAAAPGHGKRPVSTWPPCRAFIRFIICLSDVSGGVITPFFIHRQIRP